jgi:hypothetical protein
LETQKNRTGDPTTLDPQVKYYIMYYTFYYIEYDIKYYMIRFGDPENQTGEPTPLDPQVKYYIMYYMIRFGDPAKSNRGPNTFRSTSKVLYNVLYFL